MYKDFDKIENSARIWVYQLDRQLAKNELAWLREELEQFCNQWQAHGSPLTTSYQVLYDQFLILAVDESSGGASGCSIDGSVHLLKALSDKVGISFFDRTLAAFKLEGTIKLYPIAKLKELFAAGVLKSSDITFNNLVSTKGELLVSWEVMVSDSWLAKYLPKKALA